MSALHPGYHVSPLSNLDSVIETCSLLDFAMIRAELLSKYTARGVTFTSAVAVWRWANDGTRTVRAIAIENRARIVKRCSCGMLPYGAFECARCGGLGFVEAEEGT